MVSHPPFVFADDTMAYHTVRNMQDAEEFQRDMDNLVKWEKTWQMEFHPDKCEIIRITRKRNTVKYPYTLHGHLLNHVDVVKYLGVKISHDLPWNDHIDCVTSKANSTLGFVRRNINVGNPQIKERAYKTLVRPILEYSSTVWDPTATKKIKSVQRRAARTTLNRYRRTSSVGAMLTELNWQLLAERRRIARLVMFYKIHYHLVAITMPLKSKMSLSPSTTENSLAYVIPASHVTVI